MRKRLRKKLRDQADEAEATRLAWDRMGDLLVADVIRRSTEYLERAVAARKAWFIKRLYLHRVWGLT